MTPLWMGCGGQLDAARLEAYDASGRYVAEPKRDGMWAVCLAQDTQQVFSRQGHAKVVPLPHLPTGTIVVGELGCGSQTACARRARLGHPFMDLFDLLQVDGQDISQLDDTARRTLLEATWASWRGVTIIRTQSCAKHSCTVAKTPLALAMQAFRPRVSLGQTTCGIR
jgi:hypothetical protein